ncbi:hypothetical protein QFZ74_005667 [Streptomyces sp. V3I7]|nr:hypothetical protein [Streptomyces sp. V3I7]
MQAAGPTRQAPAPDQGAALAVADHGGLHGVPCLLAGDERAAAGPVGLRAAGLVPVPSIRKVTPSASTYANTSANVRRQAQSGPAGDREAALGGAHDWRPGRKLSSRNAETASVTADLLPHQPRPTHGEGVQRIPSARLSCRGCRRSLRGGRWAGAPGPTHNQPGAAKHTPPGSLDPRKQTPLTPPVPPHLEIQVSPGLVSFGRADAAPMPNILTSSQVRVGPDLTGGMPFTNGIRAWLAWALAPRFRGTGADGPVRSVIRWIFEPYLLRSTDSGPSDPRTTRASGSRA